MDIDSNDEFVIKNNAGAIRKFLEAVYKQMKEVSNDWLPDEMFINGLVNLEWTYRYLSGLPTKIPKGPEFKIEPVFPTHISLMVKMIKETSSISGSHDYESSVTNYTLKCLTYGLLDLLLWFKKYVQAHYPDYKH